MLRYQNDTGITLRRSRSLASHWMTNRPMNAACPANPSSSHAWSSAIAPPPLHPLDEPDQAEPRQAGPRQPPAQPIRACRPCNPYT